MTKDVRKDDQTAPTVKLDLRFRSSTWQADFTAVRSPTGVVLTRVK